MSAMTSYKNYIVIGLCATALIALGVGILWFGRVQPQLPAVDDILPPPPPSEDIMPPPPTTATNNYPLGFDAFVNKNPTFPADKKIEYQKMFGYLVGRIRDGKGTVQDWFNLGSLKYGLMDYKGAETVWLYATRIDSSFVPTYKNLAQLYWHKLPNYPKAETIFKKLIEIDTSSNIATYIDFSGFYQHSYKEKSHLADDILRAGLDRYPNNQGLLFALARYYVSANDNVHAIESYKKILVLYPESESAKEELLRLQP